MRGSVSKDSIGSISRNHVSGESINLTVQFESTDIILEDLKVALEPVFMHHSF